MRDLIRGRIRFKAVVATLLLLASASAAAADKPKVLFIRMAGVGFDEVHATMRKELGSKYDLVDYTITPATPYAEAKEKIKKVGAALHVLMDNRSVGFLNKYNSEQANPKTRVRGVALMGLNFKTLLKDNKEVSGIAFEAPVYSMVVQFRYVVQRPIKSVLVFYRKSLFDGAVKAATAQLAPEGITLHGVDAEQEGKTTAKVDAFLRANLKKYATEVSKYDVVWVMLDSVMLEQVLFTNVWVPTARESKIPFITGTEALVNPQMNFATFAVTPNYQDLASQASQQVDAILSDRVPPSDIGVEEVISVNKVLNSERAKELGLKLKEGNLTEVKVLE